AQIDVGDRISQRTDENPIPIVVQVIALDLEYVRAAGEAGLKDDAKCVTGVNHVLGYGHGGGQAASNTGGDKDACAPRAAPIRKRVPVEQEALHAADGLDGSQI